MRPTVSLIIPNGGGLATIKRLIRSLDKLPDDGPELKHIIVVDQADCGGGEWLKDEEQNRDNLFVIDNKDNIPPPMPYNDGLELSNSFKDKSEFIHFLDDDMEVIDGEYLAKMHSFYKGGDFGLISSEHCYFGPRPYPPDGQVPDFGMGAFYFSRNIFDQIGYLDERFEFHCSDSDYCQRVKKILNKKIAIVPGSMVMLRHYHQLGTRKKFQGKHQHVIDNDWKIFDVKWKEPVKLEFQERLKPREDNGWSDKCKSMT